MNAIIVSVIFIMPGQHAFVLLIISGLFNTKCLNTQKFKPHFLETDSVPVLR